MDKVVLVVLDGSVQAAILATRLVGEGAKVAVVSRRYSDVVAALTSQNVYGMIADLDDPEQLARVYARVEERFGPIVEVYDQSGLRTAA